MRITCPNCGAQYAVDPRVIPDEGRDVQCSSCGHTWYQLHADMLQEEEPEPAVEETLPRRQPDPEVISILREEAERERRARSAGAAPLETQPEFPMESAAPSATPSGALSAAPTAVSGSTSAPVAAPGGAADRDQAPGEAEATTTTLPALSDEDRAHRAAPRRKHLPDIEEINSTLASAGIGEDPSPIATANRLSRERQGRRLGFGLAVAMFAAATLLYAQGLRIGAAVPAFAPALSAYVGAVDSGRLWLDGALRAAVEPDNAGEPTEAES